MKTRLGTQTKTMAAYHCCVPCCTNDSRYDTENKLSFHRFPKKNDLRKTWIVKIRRDVGRLFKISFATRVCSAHFVKEDFYKTIAGLTRLKPGAIPCIFDWTKRTSKRAGPQRRSVKVSTVTTSAQNDNGSNQGYATETSPADVETPPVSSDHDYSNPPASQEEKLEAAQAEIKRLQREIQELRGSSFCLERFSSDSQLIMFYTGFKNYETLICVFDALKPTATSMVRWTQMQRHSSNMDNIKGCTFADTSLSLIDQFFLFLCRVKQGFHERDLAIRFDISQTSVSRVLITWANYLYAMLGSMEIWPSKELVKKNMPQCFKDTYPSTRVILDCTEVKVQTPSSKVLNSETYSSYKSHTTFKSLIGLAPCGAVTFVSSLYTGCISDKDITARSGLLNLIEENDQVMADKGFLIQDLLDSRRAKLVIPPFLGLKGKFSAAEVSKTHEIARLRIHVERGIRRIKEYHIFDGVIPLSLAPSINQIWTVCSLLTNFRGPLF